MKDGLIAWKEILSIVKDEHKKALSRLLFGVMIGLGGQNMTVMNLIFLLYRLITDRFSILKHRYLTDKS